MFFVRSTDGGKTFTAPVTIEKPGQFQDNRSRRDHLPNKRFRAPISPSIAFNTVTHTLEYVYQNNIDSKTYGADISLQQSHDYGATWSDARFISIQPDGTRAPNDQYMASIAVDEAGSLHAIWYDNRNDPGDRLIETFQGDSSDDGATWTNTDISSVPWDPWQSFFDCGCFIGDYTGIAASTAAIYPTWTDGRVTPGRPNGDTDVFTNVEIGGVSR
jgi:hypothetical protein